jgi:hypothetical protein
MINEARPQMNWRDYDRSREKDLDKMRNRSKEIRQEVEQTYGEPVASPNELWHKTAQEKKDIKKSDRRSQQAGYKSTVRNYGG